MTIRQIYDKMLSAWADEDIPQAKALAFKLRESVVQGQWPHGVKQEFVVSDIQALTGRVR